MTVLVTGAGGFVGGHVVDLLVERGEPVRILTLQERGDSVRVLALLTEDTTWLEKRGVAVFRGDIRDPDTLTAPMRSVDTVFHLAAMQGVWLPIEEYYKVNVAGTENVCRSALAAGVRRIVHVSSWTIYGMARGRPLTENDLPAPWHDPYWITKAQGDLLGRTTCKQLVSAALHAYGQYLKGDNEGWGEPRC